jgi:plasmid maintenance system antidote protein VapI
MAAAHGVVRYPGCIALGINSKALSKIINGKSGISLVMAFRLSMAFGDSPESWMGHQMAYDLWKVEQQKFTLKVTPLLTHCWGPCWGPFS